MSKALKKAIRGALDTAKVGDNASYVDEECMSPIRDALEKHMVGGSSAPIGDLAHYLIEDFKSLAKDGAKRAHMSSRLLGMIMFLVDRLPAFRAHIFGDNLRLTFLRVLDNRIGQLDRPQNIYQRQMVELRTLLLKALEGWDSKFGRSFPLLRAFCRFLRESKGYLSPVGAAPNRGISNDNTSNTALLSRHNARQTRVTIVNAFRAASSVITEAEELLKTLSVLFEALFPSIADGLDIEWEDDELLEQQMRCRQTDEAACSGFVTHVCNLGLISGDDVSSVKLTENEVRSADNAVLVDSIRETAEHMVKTILPRLKRCKEQLQSQRSASLLTAGEQTRLEVDAPALLRRRVAARLDTLATEIHDVLQEKCRPLLQGKGVNVGERKDRSRDA